MFGFVGDKWPKIFTRSVKRSPLRLKPAGLILITTRHYAVVTPQRQGNMPKECGSGHKRAMGKDRTDYEELVYEGYTPHGCGGHG